MKLRGKRRLKIVENTQRKSAVKLRRTKYGLKILNKISFFDQPNKIRFPYSLRLFKKTIRKKAKSPQEVKIIPKIMLSLSKSPLLALPL